MQIKKHLVPAFISAIMALMVSAAAAFYLIPPPKIERVFVSGGLKHAWPALSDKQKSDLAARFGGIPNLKLDIVCGDAACTDLAQDIDDAAEKAGVSSQLDHPITALGYGVGVRAGSEEQARRVADALEGATGASFKPITAVDHQLYGWTAIYIGKAKE